MTNKRLKSSCLLALPRGGGGGGGGGLLGHRWVRGWG